ncbi:MAG TPA: hypothetical protein V6D23_04485 [Candidatus Obscuribacterales bacterium]
MIQPLIQTLGSPRLSPELRRQIFAGDILQIPASETSLLLAAHASALLRTLIPSAYPESLHEIWGPSRMHQAVSRVRSRLPQDPGLRQLYAGLLQKLGLDLQRCRVDQPRLRAVIPGTETLPAAAPMYFAHRDTWYANPSAQLNLWIPLADYPAAQTFVFWPQLFGREVANDSRDFDYTAWKQNTGFQNPQAPPSSSYPRALELPVDPPLGFDCRRGELLLFSAAQLHQTRPNPGPDIRFSLDLRVVCLDDREQGRQALDPDNASHGSTLEDYVYLGAGA